MLYMDVRTVFFVIFASVVAAKLDPSSEETIYAGTYDGLSVYGFLVTEDFGVVQIHQDDDDEGPVESMTFSTGIFVQDHFSLMPAYTTLHYDYCGESELVPLDETSFIAICQDWTENDVSLNQITFNSNGSMNISRSSGIPSTSILSQSAFVTQKGYLYLATPYNNISVSRLDINTFEFTTVIENLVAIYPPANGLSVTDFHVIPQDEGVFMILGNDTSPQILVYAFFNGTVIDVPIPPNQILSSVGRDRGSSFAYTVGTRGDDQTVVTSWDLANHNVHPTSSITISGTYFIYLWAIERAGFYSSHFVLDDSVFILTFANLDSWPHQAYIYELPYSERGFLTKYSSFVTFNATSGNGAGPLATGTDGQYVYCVDGANITRWKY